MSKYYTAPVNVEDGNVIYAKDLNDVSATADTGFALVETDVNELQSVTDGQVEKARKWAEEDHNVEVEPGKYSSKSHSIDSESAKDASVVAQGLSEDAKDASVVAQGLSEVAQGLSEDARDASVVAQGLSEDAKDASVVAKGLSEDARDSSIVAGDKAYDWAEEAEDVEVEPGEYSAHHWANKAAEEVATIVNPVQKTSDTGSVVMPKGTTAERDGTPSSGYMRFNTEESTFEGYDGIEWGSIGGGGMTWELSSSGTVSAEAGKGYLVSTGSVARQVSLPIGVLGESVGINDVSGNCSVNNITIVSNGSDRIMGLVENFLLDINSSSVTFTYSDASNGWKVTGGNW